MNSANSKWHTYSFDSETIADILTEMSKMLSEIGVDIANKQQLKTGLEQLFHIEYHNMPNLKQCSYILASNHVSDFDALILGLLHPNITILSKNDWVENKKLMPFLSLHYQLIGIDRQSKVSQTRALVELIKCLNEPQVHHTLIFPQGTISDINKNSLERIHTGIFILSRKSKTPILPIYVEQVNFNHPTRIVFGEPMDIMIPKEDCQRQWIEQIITLQNSVTPPARSPVLTEKHAHNNRPEEPYFN
jgi:1-acyl-sn-glycerol-3-phosphate acyltransferase